MSDLFKSRKFWITVFDVVVSTTIYFVTKYVNPAAAEDILWVIATYQPVIISLITGIAIEDAALKRAQG